MKAREVLNVINANLQEHDQIWDILTALRAPDVERPFQDELKRHLTARIRGVVLSASVKFNNPLAERTGLPLGIDLTGTETLGDQHWIAHLRWALEEARLLFPEALTDDVVVIDLDKRTVTTRVQP